MRKDANIYPCYEKIPQNEIEKQHMPSSVIVAPLQRNNDYVKLENEYLSPSSHNTVKLCKLMGSIWNHVFVLRRMALNMCKLLYGLVVCAGRCGLSFSP